MRHRLPAVMRRKQSLLTAIAGALLVATAAAVPARLDGPGVKARGGERPAHTATLTHDPQFILEAVARRMGITLRPDIPPPAIRFESGTQLGRMQVAAERQWGSRPTRFLNAYIAASNEIYLIDDAALYERHSRTIDEALAHELVHYFQAAYRNEGLAGDVPELEAVGVQGWFSTTFMTPHRLLAGASHGAVEH